MWSSLYSAHYAPLPRHNHQSQHSQQIDHRGQEESETQILQFAETSNKSFSNICNIPISCRLGCWVGLSQGLDFFFWKWPSITICEFNATFYIEASKLIYFVLPRLPLICTLDFVLRCKSFCGVVVSKVSRACFDYEIFQFY